MRKRQHKPGSNARSKKAAGPKSTPRQRAGLWVGIAGYALTLAAVTMLIGGAVYLPPVLSAQRAESDLLQNGAPATGLVVEIGRSSTPHSRPGGGSTTYYPVTVQGTDGVERTTRWPSYATRDSGLWVEGARLPLLYDPLDPERAVIASDAASQLIDGRVRLYQGAMLAGIPTAAAAAGLLIWGGRLNPRRGGKPKRSKSLPR
ncbi:DUF3592 domain-containing protein [Paeniglutamicibacter sp. R2-26]|uniref:DUF3592 domain-containing protein n=1 Tax=Paeniglutamicibacter sp. R2-26 TaxID=3144417 RepID=UPI003EE49C28